MVILELEFDKEPMRRYRLIQISLISSKDHLVGSAIEYLRDGLFPKSCLKLHYFLMRRIKHNNECCGFFDFVEARWQIEELLLQKDNRFCPGIQRVFNLLAVWFDYLSKVSTIGISF